MHTYILEVYGISIDIDSLIFGERYGSDTLVCIRHAGLYGKDYKT